MGNEGYNNTRKIALYIKLDIRFRIHVITFSKIVNMTIFYNSNHVAKVKLFFSFSKLTPQLNFVFILSLIFFHPLSPPSP